MITGIITTGFHCLSGFIAGFVRDFVGRTIFFCVTVENIPAGGQLDQPFEAGQRKSLIMNQMGNLQDLSNIKI
jgi:hypothetical protein